MRAGGDGRFAYHMAPSTRPFETDVPGVTAATPYQLTVTTDDGRTRGFPLPEIGRGDVLDRGVIRFQRAIRSVSSPQGRR